MSFKRVHLCVGLTFLFVFLATGLAMTLFTPPLAEQATAYRLMFRSRHIYLMAGAALNALLGIYLQRRVGALGGLQAAGSVLLLASPALALCGFIFDPRRALDAAAWGHWAAYTLFGGTLLHLLAAITWNTPRR